MTDLDKTKLCAEAMGFKVYETSHNRPEHSLRFIISGGNYWPLYDDGQAMALVKRFMLVVDAFTGFAERGLEDTEDKCRCYSDESLNRAIVECVAKMQSAES